MSKFKFEVSQVRTQNWVIEVEAETEDAARETLFYGFEEEHGFFIEDTEGLTVLDDDGPVGVPGTLIVGRIE